MRPQMFPTLRKVTYEGSLVYESTNFVSLQFGLYVYDFIVKLICFAVVFDENLCLKHLVATVKKKASGSLINIAKKIV